MIARKTGQTATYHNVKQHGNQQSAGSGNALKKTTIV